jgi:hypothetical protein
MHLELSLKASLCTRNMSVWFGLDAKFDQSGEQVKRLIEMEGSGFTSDFRYRIYRDLIAEGFNAKRKTRLNTLST